MADQDLETVKGLDFISLSTTMCVSLQHNNTASGNSTVSRCEKPLLAKLGQGRTLDIET
jgi:hypothetical protein